jgi:uncharacterized protein YabN with tetrapyrrole methylase and pyrophosphatase domain
MIQPPSNLRAFESLLQIVEALRGPNGCPWDKEQTHRSLAPFAIEEAHELAEAIEGGSAAEMIGELGDVLLQVVLHAEIGRQAGAFDIFDVIEGIGAKMVRRHPHVFASAATGATPSDSSADSDGGSPVAIDLPVQAARTSEEVLKNWAAIKSAEKSKKGDGGKALARGFEVPVALPALARAQKIGAKTREARFDWDDWRGVWEKIEEELGELKEACERGGPAEQESELGDLLFTLAQLARHLRLEAEQSLRTTSARFERRYLAMRALLDADGRDFAKMPVAEMEPYWQRAKAAEKEANKGG